jgi:hypothetical protein
MRDKTIKFNSKFITFLLSVFLFMIIIGFSYAFWRKTVVQANPNTITTLSCMSTTISDVTSAINLTTDYAISDTEGMSRTPYTFSVTNGCSSYVKVTINLEKLSTSTLNDSYIKLSLNSSGVSYSNAGILTTYPTTTSLISGSSARVINNGVYIGPNSTKSFDLRAWVDEATTFAEGSNKTFSAKVTLVYEPIDSTGISNSESFAWTHSGETTANGGMKMMKQAATTQLSKTNEYRYYGSNPNNYVTFNGELWRIIGIFNTTNASGNLEYRLKLIRNSSIGNYSWDSSDSTVNTGYGINEWSVSDLKSMLNDSSYYNQTSGTCYNGSGNTSTACDFTLTGLSTTAKSMIAKAKYYTAGIASLNVTPVSAYNSERSNTLVTSPADGITRAISWTGYVGVMYPSDYGYAVNENKCSTTLDLYNGATCTQNNWLFSSSNEHLLNASTTAAYSSYNVTSTGNVNINNTSTNNIIRPVVYLIPTITISGGAGTSSNPYTLSI